MVMAPLFRRALAQQCVLRNAMLPIAVASAVTLSALPNAALAQTHITAPAAEACVPVPINRAFAVSFANVTRVEPGAGPMIPTKASAILGGAVSKLDQMRSVQNPGQSIALNMAPTLPLASDCTRASDSFAAPVVATRFKDAILGAQSVAIARTPFDRDWAAVQPRPHSTRVQHALAKSGAHGSSDKIQQVQMVNRWVNQNIAFGEDQAVYRRADYWAPANETLRRGIGDCEDFAIAKMDMLAALGVARSDMRLIIARDLVRNADHAVLIVKMDGGSVMLDNVTDRLLDGSVPNDYRPIMSFSQNAKWVHGYGVQQPADVRFASLPVAVIPASPPAPEVFAVTAELELPAISIAWLSAPLVLPTLL